MSLRLTTQVGLLTLSRAAGVVMNAAIGLVVVRHLSAADYGTFRQVYLLYGTLLLVGDVGLSQSLYYFVPLLPQRRNALVARVALAVAGIQIVVGSLLVRFAHPLGVFLNNPDLPEYMGLLAVFLGLSVFTRTWDDQLIAAGRVPFASIVIVTFELLKVALMAGALVLGGGIRLLLWALVAAAAAKAVSYLVFLATDLRFTGMKVAEVSPRAQVLYALAIFAPGVLALLSTQAHQYIVGHYYRPEEYALYAVACFQVPFLGVLSTSIADVFVVKAARLWSANDVSGLSGLWLATSRKAMMVFLPVAAGVAVLSKPLIVVLFTARYAAAAPLFAILALSVIMNGLYQDALFRACGAMKTYSSFHVSRGLLGVLLGLVGVKLWGLWGAAASVIVALSIVNLLQLLVISRLLRTGFRRVLPWNDLAKMLFSTVVAGVVSTAAIHGIQVPAAAVALGTLIFAVVYGLMLLTLALVKWEEAWAMLRHTRGELREIAGAARQGS